MATERQRQAARRNVGAAIDAAKHKRTIAAMPKKTRQELYREAQQRGIPGRSRMGRAELARALGRS